MYWQKLPIREVKQRVFEALEKNINYKENILGLPATYLDQEQFYFNAPFLKDAAFLSVLINNPNHIGCHTNSEGEEYFRGTHELEIDLIRICAEEIFGAEKNGCDGYVASGGTEANIQAQWIYRNYFKSEKKAKSDEIGVLFSSDAHYSVYKGCNLLGIKPIEVAVLDNKLWDLDDLALKLAQAKENGIKYLIIHLSMGTTMFGSVDLPEGILEVVKQHISDYFVHVDAAFGGFIYPFTSDASDLSFKNKEVSSITIDGHKMLQAPYGTGIFLCRKGLMEYAQTQEAAYVQGTDFTLCGSRSGANAVAVWMILMTHGSEGWKYMMEKLIDRTDSICDTLDEMKIEYYRHPAMNIVTIKSKYISRELAHKYHLVADDFNNPKWWKIVTMMHVEKPVIDRFLIDLKQLQLDL
ncbi:MAG: pyridoxal-dependent decarboxylase [Crocinitomicaceae bacterium]